MKSRILVLTILVAIFSNCNPSNIASSAFDAAQSTDTRPNRSYLVDANNRITPAAAQSARNVQYYVRNINKSYERGNHYILSTGHIWNEMIGQGQFRSVSEARNAVKLFRDTRGLLNLDKGITSQSSGKESYADLSLGIVDAVPVVGTLSGIGVNLGKIIQKNEDEVRGDRYLLTLEKQGISQESLKNGSYAAKVGDNGLRNIIAAARSEIDPEKRKIYGILADALLEDVSNGHAYNDDGPIHDPSFSRSEQDALALFTRVAERLDNLEKKGFVTAEQIKKLLIEEQRKATAQSLAGQANSEKDDPERSERETKEIIEGISLTTQGLASLAGLIDPKAGRVISAVGGLGIGIASAVISTALPILKIGMVINAIGNFFSSLFGGGPSNADILAEIQSLRNELIAFRNDLFTHLVFMERRLFNMTELAMNVVINRLSEIEKQIADNAAQNKELHTQTHQKLDFVSDSIDILKIELERIAKAENFKDVSRAIGAGPDIYGQFKEATFDYKTFETSMDELERCVTSYSLMESAEDIRFSTPAGVRSLLSGEADDLIHLFKSQSHFAGAPQELFQKFQILSQALNSPLSQGEKLKVNPTIWAVCMDTVNKLSGLTSNFERWDGKSANSSGVSAGQKMRAMLAMVDPLQTVRQSLRTNKGYYKQLINVYRTNVRIFSQTIAAKLREAMPGYVDGLASPNQQPASLPKFLNEVGDGSEILLCPELRAEFDKNPASRGQNLKLSIDELLRPAIANAIPLVYRKEDELGIRTLHVCISKFEIEHVEESTKYDTHEGDYFDYRQHRFGILEAAIKISLGDEEIAQFEFQTSERIKYRETRAYLDRRYYTYKLEGEGIMAKDGDGPYPTPEDFNAGKFKYAITKGARNIRDFGVWKQAQPWDWNRQDFTDRPNHLRAPLLVEGQKDSVLDVFGMYNFNLDGNKRALELNLQKVLEGKALEYNDSFLIELTEGSERNEVTDALLDSLNKDYNSILRTVLMPWDEGAKKVVPIVLLDQTLSRDDGRKKYWEEAKDLTQGQISDLLNKTQIEISKFKKVWNKKILEASLSEKEKDKIVEIMNRYLGELVGENFPSYLLQMELLELNYRRAESEVLVDLQKNSSEYRDNLIIFGEIANVIDKSLVAGFGDPFTGDVEMPYDLGRSYQVAGSVLMDGRAINDMTRFGLPLMSNDGANLIELLDASADTSENAIMQLIDGSSEFEMDSYLDSVAKRSKEIIEATF